MQSILHPDGTLALIGTDETRIVTPAHAKYAPLLALHHQHATVDLSAARAPKGHTRANPLVFGTRKYLGGHWLPINPPNDPPEEEMVVPPGFGGHPWEKGTPELGVVYEIPVDKIKADPAKFQYKHGADKETGVVGEWDGDCEEMEPLAVWKDADGVTNVIDGHHRLDFAKKNGMETVPAQYLEAADADEAKAIGKNLNHWRTKEDIEDSKKDESEAISKYAKFAARARKAGDDEAADEWERIEKEEKEHLATFDHLADNAKPLRKMGETQSLSRDAAGHEHKGKGPGGGQFTSGVSSGSGHSLKKAIANNDMDAVHASLEEIGKLPKHEVAGILKEIGYPPDVTKAKMLATLKLHGEGLVSAAVKNKIISDIGENPKDNSAGNESGQWAKALDAIPHGDLHHVGGLPVRRMDEKKYRAETDTSHVEGDAEAMLAHIAKDHAGRALHGKAREAALTRAGDVEQADPFTEAERARADAEGFATLPKGAKVVSLDPQTRGRVGTIVKDEQGRNRVKLEGGAGFASEHVEPLDAGLSWRVYGDGEQKESFGRRDEPELFDEPKEEKRAPSDGGEKAKAGELFEESNAEGSEPEKPIKRHKYHQVIHDNLKQMDAPMHEWSAVSVKGTASAVNERGDIQAMPEFDFPPGYDKAPSVFKDQDNACHLCGHDIKNVFWIKNDSKRWCMPVGSECVTHFAEGKSGKELAKKDVAKINRDIVKQMEDAANAIRMKHTKEEKRYEMRGGQRVEIGTKREWMGDDASREAKKLHEKIKETLGNVTSKLGSWNDQKRAHDPSLPVWTDRQIANWVKKHGDSASELLKKSDEYVKSASEPSPKPPTPPPAEPPPTEPDTAEFFRQRHGKQPSLFDNLSAAQREEGGWITIGGQVGEDGKRHGGSPVYIQNGRITKGHPSLVGKKPGEIDSGDTHHGTDRQQQHQERNYRRAVWAKKARQEGFKADDIRHLAADIKNHSDSHTNDVRALLKDARDSSQKMGVPIHHKQLTETGDHTTIPGFDVLSRELAGRYPQILGNHGYGQTAGFDVDADQASEKLLDLLRAGNPEPISEDDAYSQAFDHLMERKAQLMQREPGVDDDEPQPRQKAKSLRTAEDVVPFSAAE